MNTNYIQTEMQNWKEKHQMHYTEPHEVANITILTYKNGEHI